MSKLMKVSLFELGRLTSEMNLPFDASYVYVWQEKPNGAVLTLSMTPDVVFKISISSR